MNGNFGNALIAELPRGEQDTLLAHLRALPAPRGVVLASRGDALRELYFPEDALLSMRAGAGCGSVELDLAGRESAAGAFAVLGEARAPYSIVVAESGRLLQLSVRTLQALLDFLPALQRALMAQVRRQLDRFAAHAASVSRSVLERLAALLIERFRWRQEIVITHEELAILLGVRRAGVTMALHVLEGDHAVRSYRGRLALVNCEALRARADPDLR